MAYIAVVDTDIADLSMDLGGTKVPVKVSRGQEVPVEFLNEVDVKKSLMFGALGRLIKAGLIREMDAEKLEEFKKKGTHLSPAEREAAKVSDLYKTKPSAPVNKYANVSEVPIEEARAIRDKKGIAQEMDLTGEKRAVAVDEMEFEHAIVSDKSGGIVAVNAEKRKDVAEDRVVDDRTGEQKIVKQPGSLKDYEPKVDFSVISNFDEFMTLNHFDKLGYLRQAVDKSLLADIAAKATVKQLQNEARKRLSELE